MGQYGSLGQGCFLAGRRTVCFWSPLERLFELGKLGEMQGHCCIAWNTLAVVSGHAEEGLDLPLVSGWLKVTYDHHPLWERGDALSTDFVSH